MKNLITLGFLTLGIALNAQSFSLYKTVNGTNSATITNGYYLSETTSASSTTETKIKIKNNATTTQTFSVLRSIVYQNPAFINDNSSSTPNTYFCFGYNCFGSATNAPGSGDYTILAASGQTSTSFPTADNSTANGQPFTIYIDEAAAVGDYLVKYRVYNVANNNDSLAFFVRYNNAPLGLEEVSLSNADVSIYPNPASSEINLNVNSKNTETIKVSVYNVTGALVYQEVLKVNEGLTNSKISAEHLQAGLYQIVISDTHSQVAKTIVINK